MMTDGDVAVVREYLRAIETFDAEGLARLAHPDMEQIEHPNRLYAKGQVRSIAEMARDLPRGAQMLRRQAYPIGSIVAADNKVVVETRWEGELAVPLGQMQAGDSMVAHICMVFTLRDGRIVRQVNYDCYEPF